MPNDCLADDGGQAVETFSQGRDAALAYEMELIKSMINRSAAKADDLVIKLDDEFTV